jgi:GTP-binding protein HflX
LHVVDASNVHAEEHIVAVKKVLKELECDSRPTLLVLNKVDQLKDMSYLQVLQAHHPRAVAISAATGQGLDSLRDAVIEMISAEFAHVTIDVDAGNGRVLAYLAQHADIFRQEFHDNRIKMFGAMPRHLVRHIQEPGVEITENGKAEERVVSDAS